MRIDQFLWCIRLYKSRNIASHSCKKGWIKINGQVVKPSREPFVGDQVSVRHNQVWREFQILEFPKSRVSAKWVSLYVHETTTDDTFEVQEMQHLAADGQRERGTGRPTKRDRRKIDDLQDSKEKTD